MIQFLVRDITAKMGHLPDLRPLFWKYREGNQQISTYSVHPNVVQSLPFKLTFTEIQSVIGYNINVAKLE